MINIYFDRKETGSKGDQIYLRCLLDALLSLGIDYRLIHLQTYIDDSFYKVSLRRLYSILFAFFILRNSIKHSLVFSLKTSRILSESPSGIVIGSRLASLSRGQKIHQYHLVDLESSKIPTYLPKCLRLFEINRLKGEERRLKDFDKFFVSKQDCRAFPSSSFVLPLKKNSSLEISAKYSTNRVVFWGNLGYYPNSEAVKFLIKLKMHQDLREMNFTIIGSGLSRKLVRKCLSLGIELKGFVSDLEEELLKGGIAVFPMSGGGGVQNKFIEAVLLNLPVVFSKEVGIPFDLSGLAIQNMDPETWVYEIRKIVSNAAPESARVVIYEKVSAYLNDIKSINQIKLFYETHSLQS